MNRWLGVELRHLEALAAVAEEQAFRGAADRLGYVQSTVSQRISQLEVAVGARLVERARGHKRVALTDAGITLLHHAEQIQAHLSAARADLRALVGDADPRPLRVGTYGGLATRIVPRALALLAKRTPASTIEIQGAPSDRELFDAVETGQLDAAFAELPLEPGAFEWRELLIDPLVALVPSESSLADDAARPELLRGLAAEPFVMDPTWRGFALVEAAFAAAGLEIDVRFTATSSAAVQALVAAGLGVAIMSRLTVDHDDPATQPVDLTGILAARTLVCYWPRARQENPDLERFISAMKQACSLQEATLPAPRAHLEPAG